MTNLSLHFLMKFKVVQSPLSLYLAKAILEQAFVGQSRDSFSVVQKHHSVLGVCSMFGSFIKFTVVFPEESSTDTLTTPSKRRRLEDSSANKCVPKHITEKNRKDMQSSIYYQRNS